MAGRVSFIVQAFENKRGRLTRTSPVMATSRTDAIERAKAIASRAAGVAAIRLVATERTGEQIAATILSQFGQLPDGFADQIGRKL